MKKRNNIPIYVLSASILLSALIIAAAFSGRTAEVKNTIKEPVSETYAASLNWNAGLPSAAIDADRPCEAVRNMVLARVVIPEDYFRYLSEDLTGLVTEYNIQTESLKDQYTDYARAHILGIFENDRAADPDRPSLLDSEALICEATAHAAHCALYRNASQLFFEDPAAAWIVAGEGGGSGGMWYTGIHTPLMTSEFISTSVDDYFTLVDALLDKLDAACSE